MMSIGLEDLLPTLVHRGDGACLIGANELAVTETSRTTMAAIRRFRFRPFMYVKIPQLKGKPNMT